MRDNPVLRESLDIFFNEGHGFAAYFYLVIILAPVEFLSLYLPSLDAQMWTGSASLFKVCAVTALLLITYFALRVANQEFAPWRFLMSRRWIQERGITAATIAKGQLTFLVGHVTFSVFLCAPFLVWAASIARTSPRQLAGAILLVLFYALSYSLWGLVTLILWERRIESRQVFIRCFFFSVVFVSALFYLPLNPVAFLLAYLGRQELAPLTIAGVRWSAATIHFAFHFFLSGMALAVYAWALKREATL